MGLLVFAVCPSVLAQRLKTLRLSLSRCPREDCETVKAVLQSFIVLVVLACATGGKCSRLPPQLHPPYIVLTSPSSPSPLPSSHSISLLLHFLLHSLPLPLPREQVKARDQSSERSGYLFIKGKRGGWKRRWFVLSNLALYSFAKHEDRAAKESIIVPSHKLVYPFEVWCGRVGGGWWEGACER